MAPKNMCGLASETNERKARRCAGVGGGLQMEAVREREVGVVTYEILGDRARCGKVWLSRGASVRQRGSRYAAVAEQGGVSEI